MGIYLKYLRKIFDKVDSAKNVIKANEFFSKYSKSFLENTRHWEYEFSKSGVRKVFNHYQIVSDVYNFAVTESCVDEALIGFTSALLNTTHLYKYFDQI